MSDGKGGSQIGGVVVIFFVIVFLLYVLVTLGKAFGKFADKNPGIVIIAFFLTVFIAFKIFKGGNASK